MSSDIDVTFPADGVNVSKSTLRDQWQTIKDEIEALQRLESVPGREAFDDRGVSESRVLEMISLHKTRLDGIPYQIAYDVISL